jgi:hypothetical protein
MRLYDAFILKEQHKPKIEEKNNSIVEVVRCSKCTDAAGFAKKPEKDSY